MTHPNFLARQSELLRWMRDYFKEHDRLPSTREVGVFLGVWQNAAVRALECLAKDGKIEKDGRYWRFKR